MGEPLKLYTFSLSHFSEKIRWMLDATRAAYREIPLTPFLHIPRTLLLSGGRGTTVPVLKAERASIQGSARILQWLAANRAPFPLLPEESEARARVLDIEARFDRIGGHVIRYVYSESLDHPSAIARFWTSASGPLPSALVRQAFPLMRTVTRRAFAITPANVDRSREAIGQALTWLEQQFADGSQHLVGAALSAADITVCALLAPLACPDQHPVYCREDYRSLMQAQIRPFGMRPALAWVRDIYSQHRMFGASRVR